MERGDRRQRRIDRQDEKELRQLAQAKRPPAPRWVRWAAVGVLLALYAAFRALLPVVADVDGGRRGEPGHCAPVPIDQTYTVEVEADGRAVSREVTVERDPYGPNPREGCRGQVP